MILDWLRDLRHRRYIANLRRRGLRLSPSAWLNDGFFLDPSHCHLITIDDRAVFGPGVMILAHDASTLKLVGRTKIQAVRVGKDAFVGARAILLPGAEVGDGSILGAGSVLATRIPAGEVWARNPARRIRSAADHRDRVEARGGRIFSEDDYEISRLDENRRREMLDSVTLEQLGYMEGTTRRSDDPPA